MQVRASTKGFTLVEMLVVLTIMGLLAAIAVSRLPTRPAFVEREQVVSTLRTRVASARRNAAAIGRPVAIDLVALLPREAVLFVPTIGTAKAPIVFPDGSSNGGVLSDAKRPLAAIDWMTGRVGDAGR